MKWLQPSDVLQLQQVASEDSSTVLMFDRCDKAGYFLQ